MSFLRSSSSRLITLGCLLSITPALLLWTSPSAAYCRTRACDPASEDCPRDQHGCVIVREPLYWPNGETELWVDAAGSALWNISGVDAEATLARALERWTSVICADGKPLQLDVMLGGLVSGQDAIDTDNVLRFRDEDSPFPAQVVAKTLITYGVESGKFAKADIEVNSEHQTIVIESMQSDEVDLEALLTHELGHFLGLDHSDVPGATMQPEAMGVGGIDLRSLEADDIAGICAIYGEGNLPESEPVATGNAPEAGCSVAPGNQRAANGLWGLMSLSLLFWRRRRSRE